MLTLLNYTVTQKRGTGKSHTWHIPVFLICSAVTRTHRAFTILLVSFSFSTAKLTKKSVDPAGFPSRASEPATHGSIQTDKCNNCPSNLTWNRDFFFPHQHIHLEKRNSSNILRLWSKVWHWIICCRGSSWKCQPVVTTDLILNQHF